MASATWLAVVPYDQIERRILTVILIGAMILVLAAVLAFVPIVRRIARELLATVWQRRITVAVVLLVTAIGYQVWREGRLVPIESDVPRAIAREVTGSWPMDRGNLARTGCTPHATGPGRAAIRWRYGRPGESFYASAAVVDDYVFIVGNRDERARVYCLKRGTGELIWSGGPVDYEPTFSSPVIQAGRLFCGEGLHHTQRGRLIALDLSPERPGALLWEVTTQGHVECTPHATSDAVFFNAGDDGVYAVTAGKSARAGPHVAFHVSGSKYPDAETALAVHDGRLYVGLGVGGGALCQLDASNGRELRRVALPYPVFTPPAIADEWLLIGMGVGDYATPDRKPVGAIYALDQKSLAVLWKRDLPGTVLGAIAIDGGEAFFGCADGRVYAIRLKDQTERSWDSGAPVVAALAVTPTTVYGVNARGRLFALDRTKLAPRWSMQLGGGGRYVSAPVIADDLLYVGTENDGFYCIGAP